MKAKNRFLGRGEAFYHITTRVVDKVFRFTPEENERNVELLRRVEAFSAVQVVSYCFMSNHLHILLRVPVPEKEVSDETLLDRVEALYGMEHRFHLEDRWKACKAHQMEHLVEADRKGLLRRMYSMAEFMRTLKIRLTLSYNLRHGREGTLWESRYKSVYLEGTASVLSAVSAYIDLNPVRAGMVSDPMEYHYSSYGEACRGDKKARAGICRIYQEGDSAPTWTDVAPLYRTRLVLKALPSKKRAGMTPEDIHRALEEMGNYSVSEVVSDRCPCFTTGKVLGTPEFMRLARSGFYEREEKPLKAPSPLPPSPA